MSIHNVDIIKVDINLDLPPEKRFQELIKCFNIPRICKKIEKLYYSYCPRFPFLDSTLSFLINLYKSKVSYKDEIDYWSKIFGIPFHKALLMQLLYELNSGCTTFVANLDDKNTMIRTFDWPELFIKELLYQATFYRGGKMIYEAVCILGGIGIFTGKSLIRDFSVAINYRRTCHNFYLKNIWNMIKLYWPVSYLLREVLENEKTEDEVVEMLKTSPLISPVYFTVNLFKEKPVLIVRDPNSYQVFKEDYCIQTNCDHTKIETNEELEDIEFSVERYNVVKSILKNDKTISGVLGELMKFPVIREDTLFISVITKDDFETKILFLK